MFKTPVVEAFSLAVRIKFGSRLLDMRVGVEVVNSLEKILIAVCGY